MEAMKYITQIDVSLASISECLIKAGYKAYNYNHDVFGDVVVVYYEVLYKGEVVEAYCRWLTDGLEFQEPKQVRKYQRKDPNLKYLFNIMYSYSPESMIGLALMFKQIMTCYSGYVYCEGRFFDKNTVKNLRNVKMGQRIRQRKDIRHPYVYYYIGGGPLKILDIYKPIG